MKSRLWWMLVLFLGSLSVAAQRYVVNGKEGRIRVVQYELVDGQWQDAKPPKDIYVPNGYEFEAVPPVSEKNVIMEYEGKYYHVIWPDKELKLIDDMGRENVLGLRNRLRNSFLGEFYFTSVPPLLGLALTVVALIVFVMGIFERSAPRFLRVVFAVCVCGIALLELGGALALGSDAYWWCNPDDVGYLRAIPFTLLFGLTLAVQYNSIKMYKTVGVLRGAAHTLVYVVCGLGMVVATFAFIGVLMNFLFAACCALFLFWFFGKAGNTRHRRIDHDGKTIHVNDFGTKVD